MNLKIENDGSFVTVTNIDNGAVVKKFNCPVDVDYYDNDCCGAAIPYFKINGYQINASDLKDISGISTISPTYKATLMNELMCACVSGGGSASLVTPDLLESLIETSGGGIVCLSSNTARKGTLEIIRLEDGTIDKYVWHELGGAGAIIESTTSGDFTVCPKVQVEFEVCKPYTFDMSNGETLCFADIVSILAADGITTTTKDIVGFEFVLKPVSGDAVSGTQATTSDATSTGAQGNRNLDGGGHHTILPQRLPDNNFYRLGDQCFTVAAGSVAVLSIQYI